MLIKHSSGRFRSSRGRRALRRLRHNFLAVLSAASILIYTVVRFKVLPVSETSVPKDSLRCVAWRQTIACSPFGERATYGDRHCNDVIRRGSGYCECSDRWVTNLRTCGHHYFTCHDACKSAKRSSPGTLRLPDPLTCPQAPTPAIPVEKDESRWHVPEPHAQATLWAAILQAVSKAGAKTILPPGVRSNKEDWVMRNVHMPKDDVAAARRQWQAFLSAAPAYPAQMVRQQQGIAIVSGSMPHIVTSWVALHMLRQTGCTLPVEMWFLQAELPTKGLGAALEAAGAIVCQFPPGVEVLGGFALKAAALLLSGFEEVLLLDSDNVAVHNPEPLFASPGFLTTGAVLWPDYWDSAVAPDAADVLALPTGTVLPAGSFESGQMLFHRRRNWKAVLLSTFMNIHSALYYELLSNFMGKGDKETFAFALLAANGSFSLVPSEAGSAGITKMHCNKFETHCWHEFAGNTMVQHDFQGRMMFLHTNFRPKWNLRLPNDFRDYRRRWDVLQPGNRSFYDEAFLQLGGRDPEAEVVSILATLECATWLPAYLQATRSLPLESLKLKGFHPLHNGMDFRRPYRWGITGPYLEFTGISLGDQLKKWKRQLRNRGWI